MNQPRLYLFPIKNINKLMKIKKKVWICTNFVNSGAKKTIVHVNETFGQINKAIQYKEFEINNKTTMYADKDKQNSSAFGIKVKENTSSTSEKREKSQDGYVCMYKYGKQLFN